MLSKYSYFVHSIRNSKWVGFGTGFFVRSEEKLFFITNYHVYSGIDPITNIGNPNDKISIRFSNDSMVGNVVVDVKRNIQYETDIKSIRMADLIALPAEIIVDKVPKEIEIFEVSKFLDLNTPCEGDTVFCSGFPAEKVKYDKQFNEFVPVLETINGKFDEMKQHEYAMMDKKDYIASDQLFLVMWLRYYYNIKGFNIRGGFSGSPMFSVSKTNGKDNICLLGVIRAGVQGITQIIRPSEIKAAINRCNDISN